MDFSEVVSRRRMVRRYESTPVSDKVLDRILDRASRHPTAGFSQGIHFVVVTNDRAAIAESAGEAEWIAKGYSPWLSAAPVLVAICADIDGYHRRYSEPDKNTDPSDWPVPYWWVDAGAALMLLLLAVADERLAAGFMGVHQFDNLEQILRLPKNVAPIGVVSIGHGAPDPIAGSRSRERKDPVHREHW